METQPDAELLGLPDPTRYPWFCPKPTLRILFYTDDPRISLHPDVTAYDHAFGVRVLHDLLVGAADGLVEVDITLLDRHQPSHGATRLTPDTLARYDEVWFFTARWEPNTPANPNRELDDAEVAALASWMDTGGVLITGDHANQFLPEDVVVPTATAGPGDGGARHDLLGLGRSVGHRVPRAGLLRRWEGGPPQYAELWEKNVNTHSNPDAPLNYDSLEHDEDEWPQRLILTSYPSENAGLPWGPAGVGRRVHRLFCGRTGPIEVFPDHMHEGEVLAPAMLPADLWPSAPDGQQPRPEVVARGTDNEAGTIHDLVVAYDGSPADVGRIVADSTWHHYFNVNLKGFPAGGSVLTQLTQYYVNLAVWLAPAAKRQEIACWLRWQVIQTPSVQMSLGNPRDVGRVAGEVVRRRHGPCAVRDVLTLQVASTPAPAGVEPPLELLVGNVIDTYVRAMARADRGATRDLQESAATPDPEDNDEALLAASRIAAFDEFTAELTAAMERLRAHSLRGT